jgi:hypothetical protein
MIQTFNFTGTGRQIDAAGVSFRYESGSDGSGVTSIALRIDGNAVGTFEPGDQLDIPTTAKRWEIVPTSTGCTGTVRIGMGRVTSAKLSGVVQTIDGARARSISNAAFAAYGFTSPAAGAYSTVQLWNNGTGGKNLILNDLAVLSNSAGAVAVSVHIVNAALANQIQPGRSKRAGGADSACGVIRGQATTQASNMVRTFLMPVSTTMVWKPVEPLVIPPNFGVIVQNIGQNIDVGASFDWFEEPI